MFCPNCGANNTTEQKFCRSCGLNLEKTAESLLLQIPSAQSANLLKRERMLENFGSFAFGGFGIVFLIGVGAIIYTIITKLLLKGNVFAGILLTAFIIFATLTLIYVVFAESIKEKKEKSKLRYNKEIENAGETAKLLEEKAVIPDLSVTENTTDLLYAEPKTRKFE